MTVNPFDQLIRLTEVVQRARSEETAAPERAHHAVRQLEPYWVPSKLRPINEVWSLDHVITMIQWWTGSAKAPPEAIPSDFARDIGKILPRIEGQVDGGLQDALERVLAAQQECDMLIALHSLAQSFRIADPETATLHKEILAKYELLISKRWRWYGALAVLGEVGGKLMATVPSETLALQLPVLFRNKTKASIGPHSDIQSTVSNLAAEALLANGLTISKRVLDDGQAARLAMWLGLASNAARCVDDEEGEEAIEAAVADIWGFAYTPTPYRPQGAGAHDFVSEWHKSYDAFQRYPNQRVQWDLRVPLVWAGEWNSFKSGLQLALETHPDVALAMLLSKTCAAFMSSPELFDDEQDPTQAFMQRIRSVTSALGISEYQLPVDFAVSLPRQGRPSSKTKNMMFGAELRTILEPVATPFQGGCLDAVVYCLLNPMGGNKISKGESIYHIKLMRYLLERFADMHEAFRSQILEPIKLYSISRGTAQ